MADDVKPAETPAPAPRPLPPLAGKARDLDALRGAVVDAANVGAGLWFSYLFVLLYLVIAVGSVTHRNLLFENPVRLPFLNVDLPLTAFFLLGPALFLIVHAYVLMHFVMLAGKVGVFHAELQEQIADPAIRDSLRRQLPSNIFVQFLAGPREMRSGLMGTMLRLIALISLVIGPLALLLLFVIQFLPYHHEAITWWQRIAIALDLGLLWALWPSVARGERTTIGWRDFRRRPVLGALAASLVPVLFVFTIATFPGEWLDTNPIEARFVPARGENGEWTRTTPYKLLFDGDVDLVARRPTSLWSNRLVLPGIDLLEPGKFDSQAKIDAASETYSLRDRHLEGAVLIGARMRKVDFIAANLKGAVLDRADLRQARMDCAESRAKLGLDAVEESKPPEGTAPPKPEQRCTQLQRASLAYAQLESTKFDGARLDGAWLTRATAKGASFKQTSLIEANLDRAQLQNASFTEADLSGATLEGADLQAAEFLRANLSGVSFKIASMFGTTLASAKLQGASFRQSQLYGADFNGANLTAASFQLTHAEGANFDNAVLDAAMFIDAQLHGVSFWGASLKGTRFGREVGVVPPHGPQLQGATFKDAKVEAAFFNTPYVWRAAAPNPETSKDVYLYKPVTAAKAAGVQRFSTLCREDECAWNKTLLAVLKARLVRLPTGDNQDYALGRIDVLDPSKPVENEQDWSKDWTALADKPKPSPGDFDRILAVHYRWIGCNPANTIYALRAVISSVLGIFDGGNDALMGLLETFDRDPRCGNARAMTARDRDILATMYESAKKLRDPPAPAKQ